MDVHTIKQIMSNNKDSHLVYLEADGELFELPILGWAIEGILNYGKETIVPLIVDERYIAFDDPGEDSNFVGYRIGGESLEDFKKRSEERIEEIRKKQKMQKD